MNAPYFLAGLAIAVAYYLIDAAMMAFVIDADGSLWSHIVSPTPDDIWMRSSLAVVLVAFGAIFQERMNLQVRLGESLAQGLSDSEARLQLIMDSVPVGIAHFDSNARILFANESYKALLHMQTETLTGKSLEEVLGDEAYEQARKYVRRALAGETLTYENIVSRPGAGEITASITYLPHHSRDAKIDGFFSVAHDISDRRKFEAALQESEKRFRTVFETIETGTMVIGTKGDIQIFNPAAEQIFGYTAAEAVGQNVSMLMPEPDRSQYNGYLQNYARTGDAKIVCIGRKVTGLRKNGTEFPMQLEVGKMKMNKETCFVGSVADLTEFQSMESQLRQSQKLEAIGQLTGGVAHDFNNLLAVIQGNLSLLAEDFTAANDTITEDPMELIEPALNASRRGAELTQRLLAFSRKQALKPRILRLRELITGMEGMLRRTLGANIDLQVNTKEGNWLTLIDPSELENALLNLVLNARDAMVGGGKLTLETDYVHLDQDFVATHPGSTPGDYIMMAVSDTGSGMTDAVKEKAFDPFFTTKGVGKGSGLGLSMVHGFVKQSHGLVEIHSEPGVGSVVKLFFPRSMENSDFEETTEVSPYERGGEAILVVEDEGEVQRMAVRMLERFGYRVLAADDGAAALKLLASEGPFDLLLVDVVLPGNMSGPELAEAADQMGPGLKILFMSGYTETAVVHQGRVNRDTNLIDKPFTPKNLAAKIRDMLDDSV